MQSKTRRFPCWNPVLFQPRTGPLILFFKVGPSPSQWWGEWMVSDDSGQTWKNRRRLPKQGIGPVKNKPIQLANGEIWCGSSSEHDGWRVHLEVTRDAGRTWSTLGPFCDGKRIGAIQPSLLLYDKGRRGQMLCRNRDGQGDVWQTWSDDGGKTWKTSDPFPAKGTGEATIAELSDGTIYYNSRRHWAEEGANPRRRSLQPNSVQPCVTSRSWSGCSLL